MGTANQVLSIKDRFQNDINYPFYLFISAIIFFLAIWIINIIRRFTGTLYDPSYVKEIDITFFCSIAAIILGVIAIYKLVGYYFEFHAVENLLLAMFVFGTAINTFMWTLSTTYFLPVDHFLSFDYFNINYWIQAVALEFTFSRLAYWIGSFCLLIYTLRLRSWNNYHFFIKILFIIAVISNINRILFDFPTFMLVAFEVSWGPIMNNWPYPTLMMVGRFLTDLLTLNFNTDYFFNEISISYYFLVYNLVFTDNVGKSRSITISKIFWIVFIIFELSTTTLFTVFFREIAWHLPVIQVIFLVGLILMLYHGPEVILITDNVLLKAKKLYQVVESTPSLEPDSFFSQYTNYTTRLRAYLETIPSELLKG